MSSSTRASASVRPRMRALRKLVASDSAEVGRPGGSARMRFSTCPSSATSTTSARSGSSRTNSICLSRVFDLRRQHHAGGARQPGQHAGGFGQHRRRPTSTVPAAATCASIAWRSCSVRSPICISASTKKRKPEFGRQPPRRGVRRIDEAELLEVRHDVAHRGRRQRHRDDAREIARADRLAGREIALDDLAEDLARALVELREARLGRSGGTVLGHRPCLRPGPRIVHQDGAIQALSSGAVPPKSSANSILSPQGTLNAAEPPTSPTSCAPSRSSAAW